MYGIEPNAKLHAALRENIKKEGLSDIYTIIPCGVEDFETIRSYGVEEGTMDTVMSIQVLCSVPRPEEMVKAMYRHLKPGGQMLVHEHMRSDDVVSRFIQGMSKARSR